MAYLGRLCALCALGRAAAQRVGTVTAEGSPTMPVQSCTRSGGCTTKQASLTLDANWRWLHGTSGSSAPGCFAAGKWNETLCVDPRACARECGLDGVPLGEYAGTYGVAQVPGGVGLTFATQGPRGSNFGSRLYLLDGPRYHMFRLKNREFSFDVDASALPCGLNGALYFVEMEEDGGLGGGNAAGARYGTGYCDARCPHDGRFVGGEANVLGWDPATSTGRRGHCCAEMSVWEGNRFAAAFAAHPCLAGGPLACEGAACGDNAKGERYAGVCDKDGCDFNPFRLGDRSFLGPGMAVDTGKPVTVVTRWLTHDGTDGGDLVEIKRLYVQGGKVVMNANASVPGFPDVAGNSITDGFCGAQKLAFGDRDDHRAKGGLRAMGRAMERGMVLALSLWDDPATRMAWLDAAHPAATPESRPGVLRGPCGRGGPAGPRSEHPGASVAFTNLRYGEIGSVLDVPEGPARRGPGGDGGFCCMASADEGDFCGKCFDGAKVFKGMRCGESWVSCHRCGGRARWCSQKDGAATVKLSLEVTDGRDYLLPKNPVGHELDLLTHAGTAKVKVVDLSRGVPPTEPSERVLFK